MNRPEALLLVGLFLWHAAITTRREPNGGLWLAGFALVIIALFHIPA